jgi:hypothetical protein
LDLCLDDVVENADVSDAKPELRSPKVAQLLDSASAALGRFMAQRELDLVSDPRTSRGRQPFKVDDSLRGKNDLMTHSGQMIARIWASSTRRFRA